MVESAVANDDDDGAAAKKPEVPLCDVCHKERFKYRCPGCAFRTCSLPCSKEHKLQQKCSGERTANAPFTALRSISDYKPSTGVSDEKFLESVRQSVESALDGTPPLPAAPSTAASPSHENLSQSARNANGVESEGGHAEDTEMMEVSDKETRPQCSSFTHFKADEGESIAAADEQNDDEGGLAEKRGKAPLAKTKHYLLMNAHRRRIWLTATPDNDDGSRHEPHSDTIFWTIDLIFRHEEGEGADKRVVDYSYTARSIPESISVATLIRQFIKPKKMGPVVSREDLDAEKMKPFQDAGMDGLMLYMQVPPQLIDGKQRYYVVNASKTILDNLRNRSLTEHPVVVVTLDSQCNDFVMLSEQEAREMKDARQRLNADSRSDRGSFGRGRGNRFGSRGFGGEHRGGFGGDSRDGGFRRGRGFGDRRRGGGDFAPRGGPPRGGAQFRPPHRGGFKRRFDDDFNGGRDHFGFGWEQPRDYWRGGRPSWAAQNGAQRGGRGPRRQSKWVDPLEVSPQELARLAAEDARQFLRHEDDQSTHSAQKRAHIDDGSAAPDGETSSGGRSSSREATAALDTAVSDSATASSAAYSGAHDEV